MSNNPLASRSKHVGWTCRPSIAPLVTLAKSVSERASVDWNAFDQDDL